MLYITYYGNATFSVASTRTTILVDPYLTTNDECQWHASEVLDRENPDAICITHVAADHVGDAAELARDEGIPVLTEPATAHYLRSEGVPKNLITSIIWGMEAVIGDITIRALETRHASIREVGEELISGTPLSFLFRRNGVSVYHMGDTSIFSDLKIYGDLYNLDVVLIGVGQAYDVSAESEGPITRRIFELSTEEAVLATRWLDAKRVVPMHYIDDEREQFLDMMADAKGVADTVPLEPGESLRVE